MAGAIASVALVIGVGVSVASSLSSLSPDRRGESSAYVPPTPSALPSPTPTVSSPGVLGDSARLLTNGSGSVIAMTTSLAIASPDGGRSWIVIRPPASGSGLAVDPANPRHAITGGLAIAVTGDGGVTWSAPVAAPPGKGPYQPLAISPVEPNVWFFVHGGRLLLTRDGSATWLEVSVPQVAGAILVPGEALGQFFLASGGRTFQLNDYGQKVTEEAPLTGQTITDLVAVGRPHPALLARAGSQGVYQLVGNTWTAVSAGAVGPIATAAGGTILVGNGGGKLGSAGAVAFSADGGVTWQKATGLPFDQTVEALASQSDSSTVYAYCYGGDLYLSSDSGRTWTLLSGRLRAA